MPASAQPFGSVRPRERLIALVAVALIQLLLALVILNGLRVRVVHAPEAVQQLIEVTLSAPPPPPPPEPKAASRPKTAEAAPKAEPAPPGGSPGPTPSHTSPSVTPVVAVPATAPPSGGGVGSGPALGAGAGGGAGGSGYGDEGGGGTDLVQIAGAILPSDYPRHLGNAGIGGVVTVEFTVQPNGRVSACRLVRSSGLAELDALTCRLIERRFRFRPSTDRFGRPTADVIEWEHEWTTR